MKIFFYIFLLQGTLLFAESVEIAVKNPLWHEGHCSTDSGAVVQAGRLRIQAKEVSIEAGRLVASGDLLLLYGEVLMRGRRLEYNFKTKQGTVFDGVIVSEPWFLEARQISLTPDGGYRLKAAKLTTCPCGEDPLSLQAQHICLKNEIIHAENLTTHLFGLPFLRLPTYYFDLAAWRERSPISFTFAFGGFLGSIVGVRYRLIDEPHASVAIEGLYAAGKGPGLGLYTFWKEKNQCFQSNSFTVREKIFGENGLHLRYSLQGEYNGKLCQRQLQAHAEYDVASDDQIDRDFGKKRFELPIPGATYGFLRWQDRYWLSFLQARVRANTFQTVSQTLPHWEMQWKPVVLEKLKILSNTRFKAGFLDFVYGSDSVDLANYHSSRLEWVQSFYRPFTNRWGQVMPKLSLSTRFYGNSPDGEAVLQANTLISCNSQMQFYRRYGTLKHRVQPFCNYYLLSSNFQSIDKQYIFSLQDAYHHLQYITVGVSHSLSSPTAPQSLWMQFDLWCNLFVNMHTQSNALPRLYSTLRLFPTSFLTCEAEIAWNRETNSFEYSNARLLWTVNQNIAWTAECRFRGPRNWRKADPFNFVLESARPEQELLHSPLSDPHNLAQLNLFWRFHPDWQWHSQWRYGWDRPESPDFFEFKNALHHYIGAHIYLSLSHEHLVNEDRFAFNVKLGAF